jgi:hypothetical protein
MFARFKVARVVGDVAGPRDLHCAPVSADGAAFSAGHLVLAVKPGEAPEVTKGSEFDLVLTPVPAGVDVDLLGVAALGMALNAPAEEAPSPSPVKRPSNKPPKPKAED